MNKIIIYPRVILLCTLFSLTRLTDKLSNFWDTVQLDSIANSGEKKTQSDRLWKDSDKLNWWVNRWGLLLNPFKMWKKPVGIQTETQWHLFVGSLFQSTGERIQVMYYRSKSLNCKCSWTAVVGRGSVESTTWGDILWRKGITSLPSWGKDGWGASSREGIWHFPAASSSLSLSQFLPCFSSEDSRGLSSEVTKVGV